MYNEAMLRQKTLQRLKIEASQRGDISRIAKRMGIPITTLWRVVNDKFAGSAKTWDAIFRYYGK